MSTEDEFANYRQMYDDLQKRVERLSMYHKLYEQVRERVADLAKQIEDFPGLEDISAELDALTNETALLNVERTCMVCNEGFLTHMDDMICPKCRDD